MRISIMKPDKINSEMKLALKGEYLILIPL
jgi:hypothetical protein